VANELKPVYLLAGTDRPKVDLALRRLRARVGEEAAEILRASEASGADVVAACNAMGLFATEARVVIVLEVDNWKAADTAAVVDYLRDPAPGTVLALVGEVVKKDSALAKACAKTGELLLYDADKKNLPRWVAAQFERLETPVDPDACALLVELAGDEVVTLENEIEKLVIWADGERVDAAAVEALTAARAETPPFALTDAWGARDVARALDAVESMFEQSSGARRTEVPRIVARFAAHVQLVRECQALAAEGATPQQAASRLRRHPYYVRKLFQQASSFSPGELDDVLVRLAQLDLAVKGESKLAPELELGRAIIATASPASHAEARRVEEKV
jgi:DNA polymerase-3 subunit delta